MRILHLDTGAELRGGQRQVLLLIDMLQKAGHHCVLLARPGSPLWHSACQQGIELHAAALRKLWFQSPRADLVHAHDARAHTWAALASRTRFVVSRRVAFPVRRSFISRWKYSRAARYLAVSQSVAQELRKAGVCPDKIDVVHDAVAANHPSAQWSPNGPVVTLATVDPQKGRDLASEAAELAHVPIVFSENLATDLQHASVFLYLTRSEGFGSAALLAMSMGVPIIASRVGGLVEVLDEGRAGMLVDNEPSQIAAAIQLVIRQPTFAAGLIERARRRVCETFTPDHLLEATLSSYRRALGG